MFGAALGHMSQRSTAQSSAVQMSVAFLAMLPIIRSTALFTDPQSVTVNAIANSLPRVRMDGSASTYADANETFTLTISHQETKNGPLVVRSGSM